jgi:hypothetical protein
MKFSYNLLNKFKLKPNDFLFKLNRMSLVLFCDLNQKIKKSKLEVKNSLTI